MGRTKIDWADWVMNPVWGCTGTCPYCYARKMAKRQGKRVCGRDDFVPTWIESNFQKRIPKSVRRVFVNSMSDLADWEGEWYVDVLDKITENPQHLFLFLSKRPWRISFKEIPLPPNAMLGYSATTQDDMDRLLLHKGPGRVSFLSLEPLMGRVEEPTTWTPKWVIVGAETGNRKKRIVPDLEWLDEIHDFCAKRHIPIFFKDSLREMWHFSALPREYPERTP
jgi:protein gp37